MKYQYISLHGIRFTLLRVSAFIISLFVPLAYSTVSAEQCFSTQWPHESSELKPDPTLHFGRLANGFRYVIKKNDTPQNRVALYLNVQAGSIHENDDERGYAHYLEHMLFNGSTNFPPGELIKYFQEIGMDFGADTNAYTTFSETVYNVLLPGSSKEEIEKGLLVISDYAQGGLLVSEEVEKERGVILAEKLTRDSIQYRTYKASMQKSLEGTLLADRLPIGTKKAIENAQSDTLRAFYERWYRPDNMVLVIVGDLSIQEIKQLVEKAFNSFTPKQEKPDCPELGELITKGMQPFYHYEQDAGRTQISLESYWQRDYQNDSFAQQVEGLRDYLATWVLRKRLERIAESEVGLMSYPNAYSGKWLGRIEYSGISASTTQENWRDVLAVLENSIRQALTYQLTSDELELAKKEVLAHFTEQVKKSESRRSSQLARAIVSSINKNEVFQSPQQIKMDYSPVVSSFTIDEVQKSIKKLYAHNDFIIKVTGDAKLDQHNPEKEIVATYMEAAASTIRPYQVETLRSFPYLKIPDKIAEPVKSREYQDIDIHTYKFANGNVLYLKKTDFNKNQVNINIQFGPGQRGEPVPGMGMLAEAVLNRSGTATLTQSQFDDALAGTSVRYFFNVDNSHYELRGGAISTELPILLNTMYTLLRDPGFRESAHGNVLSRFKQMYRSMESDIGGIETLRIRSFYAGGNPLFGMVPEQALKNIEYSRLRDWILPEFSRYQLEISVVGDADKDTIVEMVGKYFGTLPPGEMAEFKKEKVIFPTGEKQKFEIRSQLNKALLTMAWKTTGFNDINEIRKLNMMANIFEDRLRLRVRETMGAAYSLSVVHSASRFISDFGMFYVRIITDEERLAEVEHVVLSLGDELFRQGITQEELTRVKNPTLTSLKDLLRTNGYWLNNVLSGAYRHPDQLTWPETLLSGNEKITVSDLSEYASKYLNPAKAARASVVPVEGKQ